MKAENQLIRFDAARRLIETWLGVKPLIGRLPNGEFALCMFQSRMKAF